MSNAKTEKEELKNLEDRAYFELCQIIAEAMQVQDIDLLDYRISSWKNKYRKLLDGLASPNFKKKIEYLLNEYYSSVTQYIYSQIKFKENKKIESQSKALVKLYRIIKETNDLNTLKSKVKDWEKQYPRSSFLKMYQRKIDSYTSAKNLEENAFNQDEAFSNLINITKQSGTFEEFLKAREEWEKKYSIHNKFDLDDFIKHQSEIKRYSSDEYLHSISRDEEPKENNNSTTFETAELSKETEQEEQPQQIYSNLAKQTSAYSALLAISQKSNNVNEMFKWVYKNSSIKFNDKYKELILNATYWNYSPTYLNKLRIPSLNINNKSLSYEEFKDLDDVKMYAIISYFNLLLPPEKAISNNFFNSCINTIYEKSEEASTVISSLNEIDQENLKNGIEIKSSKSAAMQELDLPELKKQNISDTDIKEITNSIVEENELPIAEKEITVEKSSEEDLFTTTEKPIEKKSILDTFPDNFFEKSVSKEEKKSNFSESFDTEPLQQEQIVAISPLFFSAINYKVKQAEAIEKIDEHVDDYIISVSKTNPDNIQSKQKTDW